MSGPEPWTADRPLDADGAAQAIREALPGFEPGPVTQLGWGWDFDAFETGSGHVFRFPRRVGEQARLQKDLALLPWLRDRLDAPVPHYLWGELSAPSFPYVFSGYPKLEGRLAASVDPAGLDLARLGATLGRLFRALHALRPPTALVATAGLVGRAPRTNGTLRDRTRTCLPALRVQPGLAARARRFLDGPVPPEFAGSPCLLHDDLHAEHLLLDPGEAVRITGILDWSDAVLGDPARDLACIHPWGGEPLLAAMLAAYAPADGGFSARVRYLGTCLAFQDLEWYVKADRPDWAERPLRVLAAALPR